MSPKKDKRILGKLEMRIMDIIWKYIETTGRQVYREISPKKDLAHATILTMLRKMEQKGLLEHRVENRTFFYRPLVSRGEVETYMLKDFLLHVFKGSYHQLLNTLIEYEDLSTKELKRIIEQIENKEKEE